MVPRRGGGGGEEEGARNSYEDTGPLFAAEDPSYRYPTQNPSAFAKGDFGSHRSLSNRRRKAVVPTGHGTPSQEDPYDVPEGVYYEREKAWRGRGLLAGMFNCLCKTRDHAAVGYSLEGKPRLDSAAASALLEQSRMQQEALVETEETRDMWEWQMEQQQVLNSEEHDLIERRSFDYGPRVSPFDLARSSSAHRNSSASLLGELSRSASTRHDLGSQSFPESPLPSQHPHQHLLDTDVVSATVLLFESTLLRCRTEINVFCRVYMQQMVLSGYTLVKTLMEMEPRTAFLRKVHASYALEARIYSVMFRCFENDSFDDTGLTQILDQEARAAVRLQDFFRMKGLDPEETLAIHSPCYDPAFHQFCANKSEEVACMFSWSMAYRNAQERDRFMEAFLRAAKWVWLLHRLANSTIPPMQIVRVGRGMELHPLYIEAVASPPAGSCPKCPSPRVEFMIMPGFIAPKTVFKSKVYQHYMCKAA